MPKFTIEHQSTFSANDAYAKVKTFLNSEDEIKKFDPKLQCSFNDAQMSCHMNGSQFKADVQVLNVAGGSKVSLTVDLPLMLMPFKGKVQETLQRKLAKYLS